MASPQTVADFTDFTEREIFRFVEAGKIHFIENGRVLICLNSIAVIAASPLIKIVGETSRSD